MVPQVGSGAQYTLPLRFGEMAGRLRGWQIAAAMSMALRYRSPT